MKKILALMLLCIVFTQVAIAEEVDPNSWTTYINVDNSQSQLQGGNSPKENRLLSNIPAYANSELPTPPPVIYNPKDEPNAWHERSFFRFDELDTHEEINNWLGEKDIFQGTAKAFSIPYNQDPVIILEEIPKNPYLPVLYSFSLNGPENGLNWETYRRAASIAKSVTNARHIVLLPITDVYTENKLRSMGLTPGGSWLLNSASSAVGAGITEGTAKARPLRAAYVLVICYPEPNYIDPDAYRVINSGPKPTDTTQSQSDILGAIPYQEDIFLTKEMLLKIQKALNRNKMIGFEGTGFDQQLARSMSEKTLNAVTRKIGHRNMCRFRVKPNLNRTEAETLARHQLAGVVVIKIIE